MKYLDLPKPHGFLIWRGKQKSIASDKPLTAGEHLLIISEGEAFGEIVLGQPAAMNLKEFGNNEDSHCIRPEERRLLWPNSDVLYIHRFKEWKPFEEWVESEKGHKDARTGEMVYTRRVLPDITFTIQNGEAEIIKSPELTDDQKELLSRAERLPKTIVLIDEAVVLEGAKTIVKDGLDSSLVEPTINAVFENTPAIDESLPLYQLALVRIPRMSIKKKELEAKAMPYKPVKNHPGCKEEGKPVGLVGPDGKLAGCHATPKAAMAQAEAIMMNEGKALAEDEKCGPEMGYVMGGAISFADMMAMEEMHEAMEEAHKLTSHFGMLASNIMASPDIMDKPAALKALAEEYAGLVESAMAQKAYEDKWGSGGASREEDKAEDGNSGFLVSGDEGEHLPTKKGGKLDHRLMGAAWAALHGGYRGNKYEGPGKAQAIAKLKKLYEQEGMTPPGEKSLEEADDKAGRRMQRVMMDKLKAAWATIKELMDWADGPMMDEDEEMEMGEMSFGDGFGIAVKTVNGEPWHFAWSTNAFKDREKEIFSTKALEKYVSEAEAKGDMGFFNLWHIGTKENPGLSDFAEIKWQGVIGRILVEAGPYLKDTKGQAAKDYFIQYANSDPDLAPEGWGASPEYKYLPEERATGVYENIWKTRTSILPRMAAANVFTKGATIMALSEQQKATARKIFGEEGAAKMIEDAENTSKELESRVDHKGNNESGEQSTTPEVNPEVGAILNALASLDIPALNQSIQLLAEGQSQLNTRLDDLAGQVKSLEKTEKVKQATETPRFVWQMIQRASDAKETTLAEDDALKNKKPVQTPVQDQSGAASFFPARR